MGKKKELKVRAVEEKTKTFIDDAAKLTAAGSYSFHVWVETDKKFNPKDKKMKQENSIEWEAEDGTKFETTADLNWGDEKHLGEAIGWAYEVAKKRDVADATKKRIVEGKEWLTVTYRYR